MMLEFRLEKVDARKKVSYVKLDMDAPLRHLNLPANAKLKVFSVNEAETNRVADGTGSQKQRQNNNSNNNRYLLGIEVPLRADGGRYYNYRCNHGNTRYK